MRRLSGIDVPEPFGTKSGLNSGDLASSTLDQAATKNLISGIGVFVDLRWTSRE